MARLIECLVFGVVEHGCSKESVVVEIRIDWGSQLARVLRSRK